jgi:cobalt-precorrin 5A hydrolase
MAGGQAVSARYAIGVGARRGVDSHELAALVARVADQAGVDLHDCALFTIDDKQDDEELRRAVESLGMALFFLSLEKLRARDGDVVTRSARVEAMLGIGSVAEAAALAGAGPSSVLLAPRAASERVTCAIARVYEKEAS